MENSKYVTRDDPVCMWKLKPSSCSAVNGEKWDATVLGMEQEGWWSGDKYEPTYTWRSNILPLARTDRQRSHPAATSAFCRTPPAASAAAGSGGWWRRSPRGSHSGSETASDPTPVSWETRRREPDAETQKNKMCFQIKDSSSKVKQLKKEKFWFLRQSIRAAIKIHK